MELGYNHLKIIEELPSLNVLLLRIFEIVFVNTVNFSTLLGFSSEIPNHQFAVFCAAGMTFFKQMNAGATAVTVSGTSFAILL